MCCRFSVSDVSVKMGGISCLLRSVADVKIICETLGVNDTLATKVQVTHVSYGNSIEVNINTQSDATRRNLTQPDATRRNPTQPDATRRNPTQPDAVRYNQTQSDATRRNPMRLASSRFNVTYTDITRQTLSIRTQNQAQPDTT